MTTDSDGMFLEDDSGFFIFKGDGSARDQPATIPEAPPWRQFTGEPVVSQALDPEARGAEYQSTPALVLMVNVALLLRRPLLVTGNPGAGKSTLAYAVARELGLGTVLRWNITSRTTLRDGLYSYDALARLNEANMRSQSATPVEAPSIGEFVRLGPLGTALLPREHPRVLLIDELDKSDIDLPNDLLHVFEEGSYEIPELIRIAPQEPRANVCPFDGQDRVAICEGCVVCRAFPFVVITSNLERDFAPAFLRRCLRLHMPDPDQDTLRDMADAHLGPTGSKQRDDVIEVFLERRTTGMLATDQLLNALYLTTGEVGDRTSLARKQELIDAVLQPLTRTSNSEG